MVGPVIGVFHARPNLARHPSIWVGGDGEAGDPGQLDRPVRVETPPRGVVAVSDVESGAQDPQEDRA